ncbi:MAG: Ig-like domain-containing protein [Thermoanaerobaculia bacterium]
MRRLAGLTAVAVCLFFLTAAAFAQQLEIRYINVGWGDSVFVKGPDGTTVLLEAGNTGMGSGRVVPYLESAGIMPSGGLDYTIAGHQHCDHIGGLDEVVQAGYDVRRRNYYNGSSYSSSCATEWDAAAATTTAGPLVVMNPGDQIPLGSGALLTCVVSNGRVIGGGTVPVSNENDRSIGVLIQYGGFDFLWASDLGGGSDDGSCTGRSTSQVNVESSVIRAISPGGAHPMISTGGIDVLHVNHHGSESSTNDDWMNLSAPDVAIIATGDGQSGGWDLPRIDVVDHVLLAEASCISAPPALVLQTEEGNPAGSLTSYSGYCVGDVTITTDGMNLYTINADGNVSEGPDELSAANLPRSFTIDDAPGGGDTQAPVTSITYPADGSTVGGTVTVTATATDDVGVTGVEFYLDGVLQATDTVAPYSWSWDTTGADGAHSLQTRAYDAAANVGSSAIVTVTVNNGGGDTQPPVTSITSPADGSTVGGTVTVTAAATDDVGVTGVEFYLDGALQATDTTAPYGWSWDTAMVADGSHVLQSRATDAAGNSGSSPLVTVTVSNATADTQAPTAPSSLSANARGKGKIGLSWGASTDDVGVAGYEIWRSAGGGWSRIDISTNTGYNDTNVAGKQTYSYYVVAFDAAGNRSAASNTASATAR